MKTIFLEARSKTKVDVSKYVDKLPKKIGVLTTVQYISCLEDIKKQLKGKKVFFGKGKHSFYTGQMLGCDYIAINSIEKNVDAYLYIGDGLFHPKLILLETKKPVFVFNPKTRSFFRLEEKEVAHIRKKIKAAWMKYNASKNIGILVSTKPGQSNIKKALDLKKKLLKEGKNVYIFLDNTYDFSSLENFPFIDVFVNTMCYRIGFDDSIRVFRPIIDIDFIENPKKLEKIIN